MQKRKVLVAILIALAIPFAIQAKGGQQKALAETKEVTAQTSALSTTADAQKNQQKNRRCETVKTNLETKITRFENSKQRDQRVFTNLKARLDRLANRLSSTGADTAKLKTDIATLYSKIDKLMADHDVFLSGLTATKESTCDITAVDAKTKIGEARKVATTIRQDRLDIRSFFLTTIKADLMAIRKALPEKPETQATETEVPKAGKLKKNPATTSTTTEDTGTSITPTTSTTSTQQ
jgi:hypothetical protein